MNVVRPHPHSYGTCVVCLALQAASASNDKMVRDMFPESELLSQKRPPTVRSKQMPCHDHMQ